MLFSYFKILDLHRSAFGIASSVILVTDNVTKAAPRLVFRLTNKAYWDGNVVSQFQACS
jgi:hypothetical protein